ncbi:metal-sensing transcriptional repressor [Clostridium chrysemydis]|uniref:metal-sensing transcriptional repressor n=1 Tax=Clostridium chrysemydis TaxID=2665504 RepID=UPI0018832608|nr:metal-sensing transcriptional repressor [Clostridium chrysemydis]
MNEDKKKAVQALKTCRGQIDGIIKMLEDGRYCVDVSNQIIAAQGLLKKANKHVLTQHMHSCVREALDSGEKDAKVEEVITILNKLIEK